MISLKDKIAILFSLFFPSLLTWLYFVVLAESTPELQQITYTLGKIIQFGFPLFWVLIIQKLRINIYSFKKDGIKEGIIFGILIFFAAQFLYYFFLKTTVPFELLKTVVLGKVSGFAINNQNKSFDETIERIKELNPLIKINDQYHNVLQELLS